MPLPCQLDVWHPVALLKFNKTKTQLLMCLAFYTLCRLRIHL